jgi:hypothetical protein
MHLNGHPLLVIEVVIGAFLAKTDQYFSIGIKFLAG